MDLKRLYTDYQNEGAFRGESAFYKFVKLLHPNVTRKEVREFLMKTDSYTLHKPRRKVKNFRKIYSKGIGYQMQMDLVDLQKIRAETTKCSKENLGLGNAFQSLAEDKIEAMCIAMHEDCTRANRSHLSL